MQTASSAKRHVQRVRVGLGVDGHGRDAELAAGADDAHGDLAAVGDEDLLEHRAEAYQFASRYHACLRLL